MAKTLLIPLGGSGGGGDMSNYYTKQQIDAMFQGVQSIQGLQGTTGQDGSQGIQGIKGSDGLNGADGLQGIQGISGQNGTNGVDGSQGIQGLKGSDGLNGADGLQGIQGIAGQDGTNGADGSQGIQGIKGTDGTNGVDGSQGIQGIQGATGAGASKIELTELPAEDLLQFYTDVMNGTMIDFSQYTAAGYPVINAYAMNSGWTVDTGEGGTYTTDGSEVAIIMNQTIEAMGTMDSETSKSITSYITLFSPTIYQTYGGTLDFAISIDSGSGGGTPIQGIQGATGQTGAQGIQGANGVGYQGVQGATGQTGAQGTTGFQGIMGLQGASGSGGGGTRYDILTKSQAELAEFYQNWQTVMASNDVYVGIYPVTSVIPEYTVQGYTALLLEYNTSFGLEEDATTETPLVTGYVGAYYILPNGMGGTYGTDVTLPSKGYVDAVANTKQDTLTAGEGISIQGTTISATGGGGNAWYGTQAEFDALQSVDTNTDYFISDPIDYSEIANTPTIPEVPTRMSQLANDEGFVTHHEMDNYVNATKIMHIVNSHNWYGTQAEYEALQTLNPDTNYHIEGDEVSLQMTFTFTDSTQAVYDVFVRPTV